ncbi:MAG: hypothetical protein KJZ83_00075 [Burkholderiaceae bacterium]|nr:hypothetical protein [Burkholderiaceae bacterium]
MKTLLGCFSAMLALAGCGLATANRISGLNVQDITTVKNDELCNMYAKGQVVEQERARRGLGDCSPSHLKCVEMGYEMGTATYLDCRRLMMDQAAIAAARRKETADSIAKAFTPPPTTRTNCTNMGGMINCTSRTTPY